MTHGKKIGLLSLFVVVVLALLFREVKLPPEEGEGTRYEFYESPLGPPLLTGVEDRESREILFWYDVKHGPEIRQIKEIAKGKWVVTLASRRKHETQHGSRK